ncbi:MAG: acyl-CoA thioesterase [Candidatus Sericytochromatia bacterium]|uniref:Acyl-CoA thioesterase n=1 Tax=Candidatus Tanganyikabacteria bacterium TaxID=2961651 RepID=A0A938BMA4_9BACT|nr:acyl-CoA thioesterase [Candidatus Tanganyikabacteria bacterium]
MAFRTVETGTRVRYAETDGQRVAHHSVYLVWFELGRAAYLRAHGIDYNDLEDRGLYFVVVEARAKYLVAARYDDPIVVRTTVEALQSRVMTVVYEVARGDEVLCEGMTRLAMLNREGRAVAIPDDVRDRLRGQEPPIRGDAILSPFA